MLGKDDRTGAGGNSIYLNILLSIYSTLIAYNIFWGYKCRLLLLLPGNPALRWVLTKNYNVRIKMKVD